MIPPVLKVTDPPVPILMYHYLGEPPVAEDAPYYVSERNFERQMRLLARQGFTSVSLADVLHHLHGERELPAPPVVITFDDGHRSFCSIGSPILEHHGMTATMFVITSRVGTAGYLTWEEITALDQRGHSFQKADLPRSPPNPADCLAVSAHDRHRNRAAGYRRHSFGTDCPPVHRHQPVRLATRSVFALLPRGADPVRTLRGSSASARRNAEESFHFYRRRSRFRSGVPHRSPAWLRKNALEHHRALRSPLPTPIRSVQLLPQTITPLGRQNNYSGSSAPDYTAGAVRLDTPIARHPGAGFSAPGKHRCRALCSMGNLKKFSCRLRFYSSGRESLPTIEYAQHISALARPRHKALDVK